jgi:hypothetical protein
MAGGERLRGMIVPESMWKPGHALADSRKTVLRGELSRR